MGRHAVTRLSRTGRRLGVPVSVAAALAAAVVAAPARAGNPATISELAAGPIAGFLKGFEDSCMKGTGGSEYGKLYCPCAAAALADHFSLDQMAKAKTGGISALDDIHPGTKKEIDACASASMDLVANKKP